MEALLPERPWDAWSLRMSRLVCPIINDMCWNSIIKKCFFQNTKTLTTFCFAACWGCHGSVGSCLAGKRQLSIKITEQLHILLVLGACEGAGGFGLCIQTWACKRQPWLRYQPQWSLSTKELQESLWEDVAIECKKQTQTHSPAQVSWKISFKDTLDNCQAFRLPKF